MSRIRLLVMVAAAIFVLIIVLQNTQTVETKLLFFTISMPRAVLLFAATLIGFVLGLLAARRFARPPDYGSNDTDHPAT